MIMSAYCRVSTDHEDQLNSLENQKEFFEEYAKRNGYNLFHVYADEGISGTSLKKREDFQRLMNDARHHKFDVLVVKDISRFARNTVDLLQSIRELKSLGINTIFLTANMTSMGDSEFILTIFGALAQEESANLSKRVKWGKKINSEKGKVPQKIYGYDRIDNFTLKINEKEADIVRQIYDMYIHDGVGISMIAGILDQHGYVTKNGNLWTTGAVNRILSNSIYCGKYVNHKYEIKDYLTGERRKTDESDWFHHDRPEWAIVSEEEFDIATKIKESRTRRPTTNGEFAKGRHSTKNIFSTLIRCEECGAAFGLRVRTYKNTHRYWICVTHDRAGHRCDNRTWIKEEELLQQIREHFKAAISDEDAFIRDIVSDYTANKKAAHSSVKEATDAITSLERRREKFQEMYANDLISMPDLKVKLGKINHDILELQKHAASISADEEDEKRAEQLAAQYVEEIKRFLSLEEVTNLDMRKIIHHISVNKDKKVAIYMNKLEDII